MSLLTRLTVSAYPMVTTDFQGFSLRWPPAMPSGHFGPLSLADPGQVIIMLAEVGPALFLLILAAVHWLPDTRKINHLPQALVIGAILSVIFPVFFRYGLDFDITRLVGGALWLSYALTFPLIWRWLQKARHGYHLLAGVGYGVAIFAGLVMLSVELIAIPVPQTTYYLKYSEENFARSYWNQLEPGAQILDSHPERAILLFGRASFAAKDVYQRAPEWNALVANPDPLSVSSEGYAYVYMDEEWWQDLSPNTQASYSMPCVNLVAQLELAGGRFRRLYKVADCHP